MDDVTAMRVPVAPLALFSSLLLTDQGLGHESRTDLFNVMTSEVSYVALTAHMHYTAPV
jgi:hypothetical protein